MTGVSEEQVATGPVVPASLRSWMRAVTELTGAVRSAEPLETLLARVAEQACALIGFDCAAASGINVRNAFP